VDIPVPGDEVESRAENLCGCELREFSHWRNAVDFLRLLVSMCMSGLSLTTGWRATSRDDEGKHINMTSWTRGWRCIIGEALF
jgi:hypothetical protein